MGPFASPRIRGEHKTVQIEASSVDRIKPPGKFLAVWCGVFAFFVGLFSYDKVVVLITHDF